MHEMFISYSFTEDPVCADTLLLASFIEMVATQTALTYKKGNFIWLSLTDTLHLLSVR